MPFTLGPDVVIPDPQKVRDLLAYNLHENAVLVRLLKVSELAVTELREDKPELTEHR